MITCSSCDEERAPEDYYYEVRGGERYRNPKCRRCISSRRMSKARRRSHHLNRYKVAKGCSRCGFRAHSSALEFHHLNSEEKEDRVGALRHHSLNTIFAEIRKCELVCANCHRMIHYATSEAKE